MGKRASVTASAAAALALGGFGSAFVPVTSADAATVRPAAVSNLAPFQKQGPVTLSWTNPREIDRDVVRVARGTHAPATPHDGHPVSLAHARATHVVLDRLGDGARYAVSVWTQRNGVLSRRATTTFTTKMFRSTPTGGPGTLAGQVVDTSGDPLRNAVVTAYDFDTYLHDHTARTDADGRFALTVPRGAYVIGATGAQAKGGTSDATGYLYDFVKVPVHTGRTGLRFVLADAGAVAGTVTDSRGKPIAGVAVGLDQAPAYLQANDGGGSAFVLAGGPNGGSGTDAAGHYRITGVPAGAFVPCFAARADRHVSRCADHSVATTPRQLTRAGSVVLESAPRTGPAATGQITGTVTNPDGTPARAARILVFGNSGTFERTTATAHGTFVLRHFAVGRYDVCAVRGSAEACRTVRLRAGRTVSVLLHFTPSGSLTGVVYGPSGHRLANAPVSAQRTTAHSGYGVSAVANERGEWTVGGLTPGLWRICVGGGATGADPTGGRKTCLKDKVRVVAGRDRIGVDRQLAPGGALAGLLTDSAGRPVAGAYVSISKGSFAGYGTNVSTDGHGRFLAGGLAPGAYRVCAEVDFDSGGTIGRCAAQHVTVVAGRIAHSANLQLPADTTLATTVTDASGHALAGVDVAVLQPCPAHDFCQAQPVFDANRAVRVTASTVTGPEGTALFHGLRPGHYTACALAYYAASATTAVPATGYADKCAGNAFALTVTRGAHARDTIALDPGAAVSGRVLNSSGSGVAGVAVHVAKSAPIDHQSLFATTNPLMPDPRNDIVTDTHGYYLVRSVLPGSRSVCGVPAHGAGLRGACLVDRVALTAGTTTAAPTLTLPVAKHAALATRSAAAVGSGFDAARPTFAPVDRRIPIVSSNGWPEYRLLPRH